MELFVVLGSKEASAADVAPVTVDAHVACAAVKSARGSRKGLHLN